MTRQFLRRQTRKIATRLDRIEALLARNPDLGGPLRDSFDVWLERERAELSAIAAQIDGTDGGSLGIAFTTALLIGGGALLAGGGIFAAIQRQWAETKRQEEFLECLEKQQEHGLTPQEAREVCMADRGIPTAVWVLAGGVLALGAGFIATRTPN